MPRFLCRTKTKSLLIFFSTERALNNRDGATVNLLTPLLLQTSVEAEPRTPQSMTELMQRVPVTVAADASALDESRFIVGLKHRILAFLFRQVRHDVLSG